MLGSILGLLYLETFMKLNGSWKILGVDHVTIATSKLNFWKDMYVLLGGRIIHETEDAVPEGKSSMRLLGILWGDFRIALVEGIDREELSQVTKFVRRHGDHSYQHVAILVRNLEEFVKDGKGLGLRFLDGLLTRKDAFGPVKQIFAKRFDAKATGAAEGMFFEFVERPKRATRKFGGEDFSSQFAKELYSKVEFAEEGFDSEPFFKTPGLKGAK